MKIFAATTNNHKLSEFHDILAPFGIFVNSAYDGRDLPSIAEVGHTFEENAILKAKGVASAINQIVFADDSGLEVEALDGEPGILSARYAGENATDSDRIDKLLKRLQNKSSRLARFVCVVAVASPKGLLGTTAGFVYGEIGTSPRGHQGFGYDPIFVPNGYDCTMAELSPQEKNKVSHRYEALRKAYNQNLFTSN